MRKSLVRSFLSLMLLPEQHLNILFDGVKAEFDFNQVISLSEFEVLARHKNQKQSICYRKQPSS